MTVKSLEKKTISLIHQEGWQATDTVTTIQSVWTEPCISFPHARAPLAIVCIISTKSGDRGISKVGSPVVSLVSKFYFLWHRSILVFLHI